MGHIMGYKEVTAKVTYFISFNLEGQAFKSEGIKNSADALRTSRAIEYWGSKNGDSSASIERLTEYLDNGRYETDPEHEDISIQQLEKIVKAERTGNLLKRKFPVVKSNY